MIAAVRKRTYSAATDQIVLDRLKAGTLRVDTKNAVAYRRAKAGSGPWIKLETFAGGRTGAYEFVRLYAGGSRKAIALHKLVWMAANGMLVPDGCEIHHRKARWRNGIDDLECVSSMRNAALSTGKADEWDQDFWES